MRAIGIDVDEGLVYEGNSPYGRGVLPTPTVLVATMFADEVAIEHLPATEELTSAYHVFREDAFDPVTRLRRGRIYERAPAGQPHQWHVLPHPATSVRPVSPGVSGHSPALLHGFHAWPARSRLRTGSRASIVALGMRTAFTLWRVVDIERIATGEDLVTLRSRTSLGLLPELDESKVPVEGLPKTREVLETLARSAYTSAPTSVIDRARDAAQWCISVWWSDLTRDVKVRSKDLGELSQLLQKDRSVVAALAHTIARLHARGKPLEQERRNLNPPMEADAEYSLAAMGMILREIGWALG